MSSPATLSKSLPPRQISILVPGTFSFLHYGHFRFFQACKSAFPRVKLTIGIHDSDQSFLSNEEKVRTLSQIASVDEVLLHLPKVDRLLLDKYAVDYVAVCTEFEPQVLQVKEILCFPGCFAEVSTREIADMVYASEEDFLMHIFEDKLDSWECGMSQAALHFHQIRLYIRRKLAFWSGKRAEDCRSKPAFKLLAKAAERMLKRLISLDKTRDHP